MCGVCVMLLLLCSLFFFLGGREGEGGVERIEGERFAGLLGSFFLFWLCWCCVTEIGQMALHGYACACMYVSAGDRHDADEASRGAQTDKRRQTKGKERQEG